MIETETSKEDIQTAKKLRNITSHRGIQIKARPTGWL